MKQGFTLMEMLVTVIILGILASVSLPQYRRAVNRARLAEAVVNMANIQKGIDMYCTQFRKSCETDTTIFLPPDNAGVKLDVDLTGQFSGEGNTYGSKHFTYSAGCGPGNCQIAVDPRTDSNLPILEATRVRNGLTVTWTKVCREFENNHYCDSLLSQGFKLPS